MAEVAADSRRRGLSLMRLFGIRVQVDPSWGVIFALVLWSLGAGYLPREQPGLPGAAYWAAALAGALGLFASILTHELAHALAARRIGLPVDSITLFLFGGVSNLEREPPSPRVELQMALAGPLTSFGLALGFWALGHALPAPGAGLSGVLVRYLAWINVALGVFNLLPGFPLDGGRVLRAVLWWRTGSLLHATRLAARAGRGFGYGIALLGALSLFGGALLGGTWLVLIGLFLAAAASSSYRSLMIERTLERIGVQEAMVRDPVSVPASASVRELVEDYILARGYRGFPVLDEGRVVGVISVADAREVPPEQRDRVSVARRMQPLGDAQRIAPEASLAEALQQMNRTGQERLLVMRADRLMGLLTLTGLSRLWELREMLDAEGTEPLGAEGAQQSQTGEPGRQSS
jgi:Zn-dependent protease/predicted transcriptional regulator